jgi:hypothetical protein
MLHRSADLGDDHATEKRWLVTYDRVRIAGDSRGEGVLGASLQEASRLQPRTDLEASLWAAIQVRL